MPKALVVHATRTNETKKIAELIAEGIRFSGNEAVARGCYEHGVKVATAYPGTPSTEILEHVVKYDE